MSNDICFQNDSSPTASRTSDQDYDQADDHEDYLHSFLSTDKDNHNELPLLNNSLSSPLLTDPNLNRVDADINRTSAAQSLSADASRATLEFSKNT